MSDKIKYYQTIPSLGIEGRMNTPEEFDKIGLPEDLKEKTVLEIGCNIGAFLLQSCKRRAYIAHGVEPDIDWRLLANGIAVETGENLKVFPKMSALPRMHYDVVLLLSVTHLVDDPQKLINEAWDRTSELLIIEINDRLQEKKVKLPKGAVEYGKNKDNRTVWHIRK